MLYFEPFIIFSVYIIISLIVCLLILLAAIVFSFSAPNAEKNIAYECGFKPFDYASYPFDIHFYRIGILFLLFDVEIIFLFPWVLNFYQIDVINHLNVFSFIILLILGFLYEIKNEVLFWYPQKQIKFINDGLKNKQLVFKKTKGTQLKNPGLFINFYSRNFSSKPPETSKPPITPKSPATSKPPITELEKKIKVFQWIFNIIGILGIGGFLFLSLKINIDLSQRQVYENSFIIFISFLSSIETFLVIKQYEYSISKIIVVSLIPFLFFFLSTKFALLVFTPLACQLYIQIIFLIVSINFLWWGITKSYKKKV